MSEPDRLRVATPHPAFMDAEPAWSRTQDVLEGRDAVLRNASLHLPPTEAQQRDKDGYYHYCNRARWFAGAARTLDAWVGTICRKPLSIEVPYAYQWRLQNIDNEGTTIDSFARRLVREVAGFGRVGVFVDSLTGLQPHEYGLPYLVMYRAREILSWSMGPTPRGYALNQVILKVVREQRHSTGYGVVYVPTYRCLELDENGFYRVRDTVVENGEPRELPPVYPSRGNELLRFIPFYIIGATGVSPRVEQAPLLPLVDANISFFQLSADLASSLHWSAGPTALITGLAADDRDRYPVGAGSLWKLPAGATAAYLEFSGHGVAALQEELRDIRQEMTIIGSSILAPQRRQVETAEALTIRAAGESASLVTISDAVSQGLTRATADACLWGSATGPVKLTLSRDLVNARLSPDDLRALTYLYQAGVITLDILLYNLEMGELLIPGMSISEIKEALAAQAPILLPGSEQAPRRERSVTTSGQTVRQMPNDSMANAKPKPNGDAR